MNSIFYMMLALITGLALGTLFFGGLWFTTKKAMKSKIPAIWLTGSFFIRTGITLTGFYFVSQNNLQRLLICLSGFIIARVIILWLTKSMERKQINLERR